MLAGLCALGATAADAAGSDYCALIAKGSDGATVKLMDNKTLTATISRPPVAHLSVPRDYRTPYVECVRSQLLPAANDYKLLELGFPVAIKVIGESLRVGLLTVTGGKAQFALLRGDTLTADETKSIASTIDAVQQGLSADYASGAAIPD
jgi:hypothetical protein